MSVQKNLFPISYLSRPLNGYLPGHIDVFADDGKSIHLSIPTQISDLQKTQPLFSKISIDDFRTLGIDIQITNTGFQVRFQMPVYQQPLLTFQGTLPAHTFLFTNPTESQIELKDEVYRLSESTIFQTYEPLTVKAYRVLDKAEFTLSRLGHFIAFPTEPATRFPPKDLQLDFPPVHIASQHTGECVMDSAQNSLFFADEFRSVFANLANLLYKQYIITDSNVLLSVDHPKMIEGIQRHFQLTSLSSKDEDVVHVLASIIRRYILIRFLDFGTDDQIRALNIPQTECLLESTVPKKTEIRGRRKSINLLAGVTIARRVTRLFDEFYTMLTPNLKLAPASLSIHRQHFFYCKLFELFQLTQFHSLLIHRSKPLPCEPSQIRAIQLSVFPTKTDAGAKEYTSGHAMAVFQFQSQWYLQDDNLGVAQPIPKFSLQEFLDNKAVFFISSFEQLPRKTQLIEEKIFTKDDFDTKKVNQYTFYGYRYAAGKKAVQIILHFSPNVHYRAEFLERPNRLYLCSGDLSEKHKQLADGKCVYDTTPSSEPTVSKKPVLPPSQFTLSESILSQINSNYKGSLGPVKAKVKDISNVRKNIQVHLNSFTRKIDISTTKKPNTTRKLKNYSEPIERQLTSF